MSEGLPSSTQAPLPVAATQPPASPYEMLPGQPVVDPVVIAQDPTVVAIGQQPVVDQVYEQPPSELAAEQDLGVFTQGRYGHAPQAAAELHSPRGEISPRHHQEHLEIASFVPDIKEKTEAEQDLIGEVIEIGGTGLEEAARQPTAWEQVVAEATAPPSMYEPRKLSGERTLQDIQATLQEAERTGEKNQLHAVLEEMTDLYAQGSYGAASFVSELAERPQLVKALVAELPAFGEESWEAKTLGLSVMRAAENRRNHTSHEMRFNGDPFTDDPVVPTPDQAAAMQADGAAADELLAVGASIVPKDEFGTSRLLSEYGKFRHEGVSVADADLHRSLVHNDYLATPQNAAAVLELVGQYNAAPPAIQEYIFDRGYTQCDPIKLLAARELTEPLVADMADMPSDFQQKQINQLVSLLGCSTGVSPETFAASRETTQALLEHGANLEGLVELVNNQHNMAMLLASKETADPVAYEQSLQLIADLARHPMLFRGMNQNDGVTTNRILEALVTQGDTYKEAVQFIGEHFQEVMESGYPLDVASKAMLNIFSHYIGNQWGSYTQSSSEDFYYNYVKGHTDAMKLLGDSTANMPTLLKHRGDPFESQFSVQLARPGAELPDQESVRTNMRALEASLQQLSDKPENHEFALRLLASYDSYSLGKLGDTLEFCRQAYAPGQVLAERLLADDRPWQLTDNLALFSGLDKEIAWQLLDGSVAMQVVSNPDSFRDFQLDRSVLNKLADTRQLDAALQVFDQFVDVSPLDVAATAVSGGLATQVFSRLEDFPGIRELVSEDPTVSRFVEFLHDDQLSALLGEDGPLHTLSNQFLNLYMQSQDPQATAARLKTIAGGSSALWHVNHEYARMLVGEVGDVGYLSTYKVDAIPLALPRADIAERMDEVQAPVSFTDMDADTRRMVLNETFPASEDVMALNGVKFTDLKPEYQDALLGYRLYESVMTTRDPNSQMLATERNREFAAKGNYWQQGDLVHATSDATNFRRIVQNGLFCGETVGSSTARDSYPFNVDTVEVSAAVMEGEGHAGKLSALKNRHYGSIGLLFHRTNESTDYGRETEGGMNADHRLVFGALPGTEVSAVLLRDATEATTQEVVDAIIDQGVYIPVIDQNGNNLLDYDMFEARRDDGNYGTVQPRIVDTSFRREGTQAGSNEGAMFMVPTRGEIQHYYVKFGDASAQKRDHLWTEVLTDAVYRSVVPALVPTTEPVIVEGRLAKASKLVDVAEGAAVTNEARNAGFIMDAFTGNWDAVFNADNLVMTTDGRAMRVDTGNGLDFRARGEKKPDGSFGPIVQEIQVGNDDRNLGVGMRQRYPDLTDEQIRSQVTALRDKLSEGRIDQLVNSVRRPRAEREALAATLKARRQYLIETFS